MNKEYMDWFRRYAFSSVVTFLATFAIYFVTVIDQVTPELFLDGTFTALVFTGVRAAVKGLLEAFIVWYGQRNVA